MAIFTRYALTRKGQQLIAKAQADLTNIEFTAFVTGSSLWDEDEDLEYATALKEPRQELPFSDISIPSGKGFISRKYLKGWITEQEGKWYVEAGDNYPHGTLREISGSVYYFNDAGWLETNREFTVKAAADGSLSVQ